MDVNDTNVLVTGGAGFLGSHLIELLLEKGANVTVADIPSANQSNLRQVNGRIKFIPCDISNTNELKELPKETDIVFHLAAIADPRICEENHELAFKVNVQGTFNALNYAMKANVSKFIFPSAASLYGKYPKYIPIDENHPIDPADSVYLTTKRFGEILCDMFYQKHGLPVIYFRLFNTFGERQGPGFLVPTVIIDGIKKGAIELWNDKPVRDFSYVKDIANALIKGIETKFCGGPINLGNGKEISVGELVEMILNAMKEDGIKTEVKYLNKEIWGPMRLLCDNTKARRLLGWEPKTEIEEGIRKTVRWYIENKSLFE